MGRSDGCEGGNDELVLDQACKLGPQGHITFSWGNGGGSLFFCASPPPLSSQQAPGLASCFLSWLHMGMRFELDRELNHISTPRICHGFAQRHKPLDIRLERRGSFSIPLSCLSPSLSLFSTTLRAPLLSLSLLLSSYSSSFYPSLFGDGVTQVSRLRNECGGLFRQPGKCSISSFFYFIRVTHLCTSPLDCEIAGVCQTGLAQGF